MIHRYRQSFNHECRPGQGRPRLSLTILQDSPRSDNNPGIVYYETLTAKSINGDPCSLFRNSSLRQRFVIARYYQIQLRQNSGVKNNTKTMRQHPSKLQFQASCRSSRPSFNRST
ncbi:hypothetical protein HHI36_011024 [Cryptolaemus montrouzieri]|uniref:Uncharacterized protein n=1 Tax=Cryptolaemus montrouzieri TaxID=559131 RepID=A0ABD2MKI0_9CUCU